MKFDDLAYFSRFGAQRQVPLPIVFHTPGHARPAGAPFQVRVSRTDEVYSEYPSSNSIVLAVVIPKIIKFEGH